MSAFTPRYSSSCTRHSRFRLLGRVEVVLLGYIFLLLVYGSIMSWETDMAAR